MTSSSGVSDIIVEGSDVIIEGVNDVIVEDLLKS